jgi:hypothetical protein
MTRNTKYNGGRQTLLTSLEGRLDMTMPGATGKPKDCGCKKKMNMGGTVPTANTYSGKR